MTNKFFNAFVSQHVESAKAATKNNANKIKINNLKNTLAKKQVAQILNASNIDAAVFSRALYACEKLIKFSAYAVNVSDEMNENINVAFRTAMNCAKHNVTMTKYDVQCSLFKLDVAADRQHLIYHKSTKISADAQIQQVIDVLKSLKILKEASKETFTVSVNAIAQSLIERLQIDMSVAQVAE